jgi:hypothetical protein
MVWRTVILQASKVAERQPCRAQLEVVRVDGTAHAVDAVRHTRGGG